MSKIKLHVHYQLTEESPLILAGTIVDKELTEAVKKSLVSAGNAQYINEADNSSTSDTGSTQKPQAEAVDKKKS